MAAYAVIARIGRVDPHLTIHDLDDDLDRDHTDDGPGSRVETPAVVERPHPPTRIERLVEQLFWLRVSLSQLTFFLFDPESWRR